MSGSPTFLLEQELELEERRMKEVKERQDKGLLDSEMKINIPFLRDMSTKTIGRPENFNYTEEETQPLHRVSRNAKFIENLTELVQQSRENHDFMLLEKARKNIQNGEESYFYSKLQPPASNPAPIPKPDLSSVVEYFSKLSPVVDPHQPASSSNIP